MKGAFDGLEGLQVQLAIPDLWQQEAIRALSGGADVIVDAPTGAGKTFVFESVVKSGSVLGSGRQAVFTVPTRALANDKWREWKTAGWDVGIATGDLAENLDASVVVATLETQRERLLTGRGPRLLVIDEYQMIGDERRGLNYELAIALAPPETQLLLLSGSVANPDSVGVWFERLGRKVRVVRHSERPVPLDDIPVAALPDRAPQKVKNYWQRAALGTLLSDYGPLLIFAPQRKGAEKIARKIAEALPDDHPIEFTDPVLRHACGSDLAKMLRKRVAWHHSGLTYLQRAAIVEPLAKAGQLRVIVATMGLAAGINFSVRSVFVADTMYQDGPFQKEVQPDELLQMFGRAGRRGIDENGYVISGDRSPRLMDARPLQLRRSNEIDWPTLLRVMRRAVEQDTSPFDAARELSGRLFSEQRIAIGFKAGGGTATTSAEKEDRPLFGLGPTRAEVKNFLGDWEDAREDAETEAPIGDVWIFDEKPGGWIPATASAEFIRERLPRSARLCRLDRDDGADRKYGLEMAVATKSKNGEEFRLTRHLRSITKISRNESALTREEIESLIPPELEPHLDGARISGFVLRGQTLSIQADFSGIDIPAHRDAAGKFLIDPEKRRVAVESETHYTDKSTGEQQFSVAGSAAQAWRKLGLIDDHGEPVERGILFSFFQYGEGLAIAAALEDEHYPIDELIWHLANLRAGHRFEFDLPADAGGGSERLAIVCRQAYGPVDYEGYLRLGLPVGYGEGGCEAVQAWLVGELGSQRAGDFELGPGDIERAYIEWLSLLRHIRGAPDFENERWRELRRVAGEELLRRRPKENPAAELPDLPIAMLRRRPQHRISYRQILG